MLSLAEYTALKAELTRLGLKYEQRIVAEQLVTAEDVYPLANEYTLEFHDLLERAMREIAGVLVDHYTQQLDGEYDRDSLIEDVVDEQWNEKYYGYTLSDRVSHNFYSLGRRIHMSAKVDPKHLQTVWSQTPMFGSQTAIDQRLLLGTVAHIENTVARKMAQDTEHKLVKWTLSHRHKQTDECDDLADNLDEKVVEYIKVNNLAIDPKGVYFAEELPDPPHPNCQCEYGMVKGNKLRPPTPIQRVAERVRRLLRRIRGK